VVARSWLLRPQHVPAEALITIAAPHTGTPLADWSKLVNRTPLEDFIAEMGFTQWTDPKGLYQDLEPENPGNFLYWLNHQPHPALRYVSLVRKNDVPSPDRFDYIVPPASQDMNHVLPLFGRVEVWPTQGSHFLGIPDGYALAAVLRQQPTTNGG
jgi:triacylglycerol lipase